jgi:regulatory protein
MSVAITSLKTETSPLVYRVGLSDGGLFSIKTVYLSHDFIADAAVPAEISESEAEELRFAGACLRAERTALPLVARAEQTRSGLERKLRERGHEAIPARAAVEHLADNGAVSDERYAELWTRARLAMKADSPAKLRAALLAKGIDRAIIKDTLDAALDLDEEIALLRKFAAKNRLAAAQPRERRQKLRGEGFSSDAVAAFEEALPPEDADG